MARTMTYLEAIREAHFEEMERDASVVTLGVDIGELGGTFGATAGLEARFGSSRVIDFPISENAYTGIGVGLAIEGFRPIVEIAFADFATVALDQIMTVASKEYAVTGGANRVPMVIRLPFGANLSGQGYMGLAGPAHSQSHESWYAHSPGLIVVMPSNPADALGLLKSAVRCDDPVVFMEQKGEYGTAVGEVPDGDHTVEIGTGSIVKEGSDLTIIALGAVVKNAVRLADELASTHSIEVIDPRTLVPLDEPMILESVKKTGRVVIAHEAHRTSGFAAHIASVIAEKAFHHLRKPVIIDAARDVAIPVGEEALHVLPSLETLRSHVVTLLED